MRKIFYRKWPKPVFSPEQLESNARIRAAVEDWLQAKGYLRPLSTAEAVAGDIGIPVAQLRLYIRFHYLKPLLSWRKDLRIEEAKRLLLAYPELPFATVGEMAGFQDKSNFRRQFKETVRMSPREWRLHNGV